MLWEHLGMMGDLDYARKWGLKRKWYEDNGFLPHPQQGPAGSPMCTDDTGGVDVPAWRKQALEAIGPVAATPSRRGPGARPKRTP